MLSKAKLLISSGLIVSLFVASFAIYQWGYSKGKSKEADRQSQAVLAYQRQVTKAFDKLLVEQEERQRLLSQRQEELRDAFDPTGCADERIPDSILDSLLK